MMANAWDASTYSSTFGFVARYGDELVDLLDPKPGEWVLDLGCGTGEHADQMSQRGAHVVGMDLDEDMLRAARELRPDLRFVRGDAASFGLSDLALTSPVDACFSNAALHWMTPQHAVLANVRGILKPGGRFVAEMGGAGNVEALDEAIRHSLTVLGLLDVPVAQNYFPTTGEQSSALEAAGFRVELATWFRRDTPLATSASDWARHFRATTWSAVPSELRGRLAVAIDERAAENGLLLERGWVADYCRLRFVAIAA